MDLEKTAQKVDLFSRQMIQLKKAEAERQTIYRSCFDSLVQEVQKQIQQTDSWVKELKQQEVIVKQALQNTSYRLVRGQENIKKAINRTLGAKINLLEQLQQHSDKKDSYKIDVEVQLSDMRKRIQPWQTF